MNSASYKNFDDYVKSLPKLSAYGLFRVKIRKANNFVKVKFNMIKCRVGIHNFNKYPILCEVETLWIQGGKECIHCGKKKISFEQASKLVAFAYKKGIGRY